jgi:TonB family protein
MRPTLRDPAAPLVLWICAAVCAHYMFAQGGNAVAVVHDDRTFISILGMKVRDQVRQNSQAFDVITGTDETIEEPKKDDPEVPQDKAKDPEKPEAKKDDPPKPEEKKEQPKPVPEKKELKVVVKEEDPLKKLESMPQMDKRIAVKQHAKKDQEDNPTAQFVGDEANHVDEESVAKQTSHDQDDPNPTPGGNHSGPTPEPGDSDKNKVAESDEHRGEKDRAPGEKGTEFEVQKDPMPTRPMGPVAIAAKPSVETPRVGGDGKPQVQPHGAQPTVAPPLAAGAPAPASPDVVQGGATPGGWTFNPVRPNPGTGQNPDPSQGASRRPQPTQGLTQWLGLGGKPGPGQININLTQQGVVAAVGQDQLRKERFADGERRKSEHRGSWQASNMERWRNAIENYVSTVKPGNQTSLNTAAVPFASYLLAIHNRIHPIFADGFLGSLDALPGTHPLSNHRLMTRLEIVVSREGRLIKMGVVRASGVTAFDIAALDSVQRASPFGPAPGAIISSDGNVYLHWEFHRDELACSTMNARPFMLNVPPSAPVPEPPPGDPNPKPPIRERGGPPPANVQDTREGSRNKPNILPRG